MCIQGHHDRQQITRCDFLRLVGAAFPAAVLGACTPRLAATLHAPSVTSSAIRPTAVPPTLASTKAPMGPTLPEMIRVEPGRFDMGSADGRLDEAPVHTVRITQTFLIAAHEVTFDEYDLFVQATGAERPDDAGFGRGRLPVLGVDWYTAVAFCNWLSEKHSLIPCYSGKGKATMCDFTADGYRLPTEAEWEYAARGGPQTRFHTYAGSDNPAEVGWHDANAEGRTHAVGELLPNELGLFDMSGNSFEWCWDWYAEDYYAGSPVDDPQGPPPPATQKPWELIRARRSGCWRERAEFMRVAARSYDTANYPGENGFRLARTS